MHLSQKGRSNVRPAVAAASLAMHELTNCVQVIAEMLHFGGACVGQIFAKSYACALAPAISSAAPSENRIAITVALADFTIPHPVCPVAGGPDVSGARDCGTPIGDGGSGVEIGVGMIAGEAVEGGSAGLDFALALGRSCEQRSISSRLNESPGAVCSCLSLKLCRRVSSAPMSAHRCRKAIH